MTRTNPDGRTTHARMAHAKSTHTHRAEVVTTMSRSPSAGSTKITRDTKATALPAYPDTHLPTPTGIYKRIIYYMCIFVPAQNSNS